MMKTLLKNWELKILALLSAIVLWFFVVGIENNPYRFPQNIDVQAINVPQDMSVVNDLGSVSLQIQADQSLLKTLTTNDFQVTVDLTDAKEGDQVLPVTASSKNENITILSVNPSTVPITLEPITTKDVKVKPAVIGNPANGYSVGDIQVNPQTVSLSGGKSLLDKLDSLTAQIKLDGNESTNFKENILLNLPDNVSTLKNVTISPQQVEVDVSITQDLQQKTVVVKPNLQGSIDLTVLSKKLNVNPQTIIIQGQNNVLNNINSLDTEPISLDTLKNSSVPLNVNLILPQGVTLPASESPAVSVSLTAS